MVNVDNSKNERKIEKCVVKTALVLDYGYFHQNGYFVAISILMSQIWEKSNFTNVFSKKFLIRISRKLIFKDFMLELF